MTPVDALVKELEALPDEQLAGVFPMIVVMLADAAGEVPPALAPALSGFAEAVGWTSLDTADAKAAAANAWLRRHGVDAALWQRLLAALEDDPAALRGATERIGGSAATAGALERKAPPPPGTVAAGPFARHQMSSKPKRGDG